MRRLFISLALTCAGLLLAAAALAYYPAQQPAVAQPAPSPTAAASPAAHSGQTPGAAPAGSPSPAARQAVDVATRFDNSLALGPPEKRSDTPSVSVRVWTIYDHQRIERFQETGFIVAHLRAGELVTVINGVRQERNEDDFWTVPEGATMSLETDRDTATLQTWAIRKVGGR